jgi:serine/threonine protein kinase
LIKDFVGTPAFASPEACGGKEYKGAVGDIWSIGVTLVFHFSLFSLSSCSIV